MDSNRRSCLNREGLDLATPDLWFKGTLTPADREDMPKILQPAEIFIRTPTIFVMPVFVLAFLAYHFVL